MKVKSHWTGDRFVVAVDGEGNRDVVEKERVIDLKLRNILPDASAESEGCEIVLQEAENGDLNLRLFISEYKFSVSVSRQGGLLLNKAGFSDDALLRALKPSTMDTWVKGHVYNMIKAASGPKRAELIAALDTVPEEIRRLLFAEYYDFGFHRFTKEMGKDVFVLWNTSGNPLFTFSSKRYDDKRKPQTEVKTGVVPKSLFLNPAELTKQFHDYCPELQTRFMKLELRYGDSLIFSIDFDKL
jgi:hypothetical protein